MSTRSVSDKAMRQVIGRVSDDPYSDLLSTGFKRFSSPLGIDGLFQVNGEVDRLTLLAVLAKRQGEGRFRHFIAEAKRYFSEIVVLEDMNPLIGEILKRYGFKRFESLSTNGEHLRGWIWDTDGSTGMPM